MLGILGGCALVEERGVECGVEFTRPKVDDPGPDEAIKTFSNLVRIDLLAGLQ